jgi:hypothetical protein
MLSFSGKIFDIAARLGLDNPVIREALSGTLPLLNENAFRYVSVNANALSVATES